MPAGGGSDKDRHWVLESPLISSHTRTHALLAAGLKEGEPVSDEDAALLVPLLQGVFPDATPGLISASIAGKSQRTYS
jgi:hypothetical protein